MTITELEIAVTDANLEPLATFRIRAGRDTDPAACIVQVRKIITEIEPRNRTAIAAAG